MACGGLEVCGASRQLFDPQVEYQAGVADMLLLQATTTHAVCAGLSSPQRAAAVGVQGRSAAVAAALSLLLCCTPSCALARPPPSDNPQRCDREQLKRFSSTRASFSAEISSGALPEAVLDLRGCSFAGANLKDEVLSGAVLDDSNFSGASLEHVDASRASALRGNFAGANLSDANLFGVNFGGADLRGAVFSNSVLSNAALGRDPQSGEWAQLQGADFEGALLSSSDTQRTCLNPTLEDEAKAVLGCR